MFFGEMVQVAVKEKNRSSFRNEHITLPDLTPSCFKDLLKYIYTDVLELQSMIQAMDICYAAKKYILPDVVDKCAQYMQNNLSEAHVCTVLEFSKLIDAGHLEAECWSLFREKTRESLKYLEKASESTLLSIVMDEELNVEEVELFKAVESWAGWQCTKRELEINGTNKREMLKKVIGHIRFLAMTSEEFAAKVVTSGILTKEECLSVFMHLNSIPTLDRESSWSLPAQLSLNRQKRRRIRDINIARVSAESALEHQNALTNGNQLSLNRHIKRKEISRVIREEFKQFSAESQLYLERHALAHQKALTNGN